MQDRKSAADRELKRKYRKQKKYFKNFFFFSS